MDSAQPRAVADALSRAAPATEFYIPATASLQERRRARSSTATPSAFSIITAISCPGRAAPRASITGTRATCPACSCLINARRPMLLSSTVQDNNALLTADLTNPDFFDAAGRLDLPKDTIHIVRAKFIWQGCAYERLAVRNFGDRAHDVRITLLFQADFADLFEVRGHPRRARGQITTTLQETPAVVFTYHGLAGDVSRTVVQFAPKPAILDVGNAIFELSLEPYERRSLFLTVACDGAPPVEPGTSGSSSPCARRGARCAPPPPAPPRSRPLTRS